MKYLPKKLAHSAKRIVQSLLLALLLLPILPQPAIAQDNLAAAQCIGRGLAAYMNVVISGAGNLQRVKLLSPAWNLTSQYVPPMFDEMEKTANFAELDGFAGNTYRIEDSVDPQHRSPYDWYVQMGWKAKFAKYNKNVYITETGNFNGPDVALMRRDFVQMSSASEIQSINYFNALNTNPDPNFTYAPLTKTQYSEITQSSTKAGINSAAFLNLTFAPQTALYGGKWTVEIINGPGDLPLAIATVKASHVLGITPILRLCVGDSCGFSDPQILTTFLNALETGLALALDSGRVYVIAGPNEPDAENWATPSCPKIVPDGQIQPDLTTSDKPIPDPYVGGGEVRDNEFHQLRPYQASPFGMLYEYVEWDTLYCGNDVIVKESLSLMPAGFGGDCSLPGCTANCTFNSDQSAECLYKVDRKVVNNDAASIEIDLKNSELPILGNTTLVPNRINKANLLDDATRVNEYVSWYLNGTAFSSYDEPEKDKEKLIDKIINFSGPLNKLLPVVVQDFNRISQTALQTQFRHNQIYECLLGGPVSCISALSYQARLIPDVKNGVGNGNGALRASQYAPLAPNEDRAGEVRIPKPQDVPEDARVIQPIVPQGGVSPVIVQEVKFFPDSDISDPVPDNNNPNGGTITSRDDLYYAHTIETSELAELLQKTFLASGQTGFNGDTGDDAPYFNSKGGGPKSCEIGDAKTNPGDDLFGDFHQQNAPNENSRYNKNITGKVEYKTNIFGVSFPPPQTTCEQQCDPAGVCQEVCATAYKPKKVNVYAALALYTKSPNLNEIADRLVKGDWSVLKRFFPIDILTAKDSEGEPLIKDYAASTKATYKKPAGANDPNIDILAGDPSQGRSGNQALIFFPHLGGVYENFLKGLQCALRPQGMCESAALQSAAAKSRPPSATGACSEGIPDTVPDAVKSMPNYPSSPLEAAFLHASQEFSVPVCVLKAIAGIESGRITYKGSNPKVIKNTVIWQDIMNKPVGEQEKYLWEGNTQLVCDTVTGDETSHNSCSARGSFQITTGDVGVYCKTGNPSCPYKDPDHCTYTCEVGYCNSSGVIPGAAPNAWNGPTFQGFDASEHKTTTPANFYDGLMGAAKIVNQKVRPVSLNWNDSYMLAAGLTYYGDNTAHDSLGGRTYGQAIVDYCKRNFPGLF